MLPFSSPLFSKHYEFFIPAHSELVITKDFFNEHLVTPISDYESKKGNPPPRFSAQIWKDFENIEVGPIINFTNHIQQIFKSFTLKEVLDEMETAVLKKPNWLEAMQMLKQAILEGLLDAADSRLDVIFEQNGGLYSAYFMRLVSSNKQLSMGHTKLDHPENHNSCFNASNFIGTLYR